MGKNMIKKLACWLILVGSIVTFNCAFAQQQDQSVVLRMHFAGIDAVIANKESEHLNKVLSLNETEIVKKQVFKQLALAIDKEFNSDEQNKNSGASSLIEPMLDDMFRNEWHIVAASKNGTMSEIFIGIAFTETKANLWNTNLLKAVETWGKSKVSAKKFGNFSGWEGKVSKRFNSVRFSQLGKWSFIGLTTDKFNVFDEMIKRFQSSQTLGGFNSNNWFEADVDLAWLSGAINSSFGGARNASISMLSKGGDVRTFITLRHPTPLKWKYEPWAPPKTLITDPIVSFTAINGSASLLGEIEIIKKLNLQSLPNQLYLWAQGTIPFATFFSTPFNDATNLMKSLAIKLPPLLIGTNALSRDGNIFWFSNKAEIVWQGLPLMTPFLRATSDGGKQYIVGGLFAAAQPGKTPAPAELWNQFMNRTNLMYYDWEFTQERMLQWMQIYQLLPLFTKVPQVPESKPGQKWLQKISSELGDAATEIVLKNQNEVLIVRRSSIGLVGFELLHLARWFDSPTFPYKQPTGQQSLTAPRTNKK